MPSFRNPKAQAAHAVKERSAIGTSRHDNRDDGRIHSLGTARAYTEALSSYTRWLQEERLGDLSNSGRDEALQYLELRSMEVSQPQLDKDRQAIQAIIGERLPRLKSEVEAIRRSKLSRLPWYATIRRRYATSCVRI